jgi:hypothetical protein
MDEAPGQLIAQALTSDLTTAPVPSMQEPELLSLFSVYSMKLNGV